MIAGEWAGRTLGERSIGYDERDAILYALAVGASAADLDLVFENRLRVLPTFALTLAQWAPDALGSRGAFDISIAVHGAQQLEVLRPMPRSGELRTSGRVSAVWDKGSAAVFDVEVESDYFVATWSIFAPGAGGFGGDRGPSAPQVDLAGAVELTVATYPTQAATYRLLGDRHHMHIDPDAARAAGQPQPFMHGLCTLAAITLGVAKHTGADPADLQSSGGRFAAPVFPGEELAVRVVAGEELRFEAMVGGRAAITGGHARFGG